MIDLSALDGKPFTLLLMGETSDGEDDWAVFPGIARVRGDTLCIDRGFKPPFEVRPEWFCRIQPVKESLKATLQDADFYLPLTVGPIPAVGSDDLLATGLKWPG